MKQGWIYKKLGEVTTTINGLWTGKNPPFINVAVVRNTNFTKDCKLDMTNVAFLDVEQKQYNSRKLLPGDIIIEKSGGSDKQPVGRPVLFDIPDGEYSFSNFTSTLRINNTDEIIPKFLHYALYGAYLRGETYKLQSKTTGIHNLDFKGFNRLPIPIPSLFEQKSIVAELDKINELIGLKKSQLCDLDNFVQSLFHEMFGDPIENEKGWDVKKLGEVADFPSKRVDITELTPFQYVGVENLIKNKGGVEFSETLPNADKAIEFIPDDILIGNIRPYLRKIWISNINGGASGDVIVIRKNIPAIIPIYLFKVLSTETFFEYDNANTHGAKMPRGDKKMVALFPIPLPPLQLQQFFAKRIEAIEQQKTQIITTINDLETLLASRMQYWFD